MIGRFSLPCFLLLTAVGCRPAASDRSGAATLEVFVGLPPYAYLVERIAGGHVTVHVLLQPGQDPHTFAMTPKQMLALGRARLLFKVGMPFEERFAERIRGEQLRLSVVDVTAGIEKRSTDESCDDDAGHDHAHEAGAPDPHVWVSPLLLKTQAANIAKALEQADPEHAADYRQNLADLLSDLDALDTEIAAMLKPCRGRSFYVFHPGFGYLADAYGLKQVAVEAGGRTPTPKQLRELIQQAKADRVHTIFAQPEFDQRNAQTIAEALGGRVVVIDPLAGDVIANLRDIATKIKDAFEAAP